MAMLAIFDLPLAFVIDTDQYAGNFEREMCAFVTGQIGECGKGSKQAVLFHCDHPLRIDEFENLVVQFPDGHGNHRPTAIWPTPGTMNESGSGAAYQSVAIFLDSEPSDEIITFMKKRALQFCAEYNCPLSITGYRLLRLELVETLIS